MILQVFAFAMNCIAEGLGFSSMLSGILIHILAAMQAVSPIAPDTLLKKFRSFA